MEQIKIKSVYRHFKGNYYLVENIAKSSETMEELVIYRALYNPDDLYVRPLKMFAEKIDKNREDNSTGQEHRFELVENMVKDYLKK